MFVHSLVVIKIMKYCDREFICFMRYEVYCVRSYCWCSSSIDLDYQSIYLANTNLQANLNN